MFMSVAVRMTVILGAHMKVIGAPSNARREQPETDERDQSAASDAKDALHRGRGGHGQGELEQKRDGERGACVSLRDDEAEDDRVLWRSLFANEVRGDHGLAMAGRDRVQHAVENREKQ